MIRFGRSRNSVEVMTMLLKMLLMREECVGGIGAVFEWMMGMLRKIMMMNPQL